MKTCLALKNKIDCSGNAETHTTEKNLQNFKAAIKELTGEEPSDRQTYELMCLIDEENYTKGFPSGEDPAIGMAFKMTAMKFGQGKEGKESIDIKYNPTSQTFSLDCTTPPSHLSAIDIPVPGQHVQHLSSLGLLEKARIPNR